MRQNVKSESGHLALFCESIHEFAVNYSTLSTIWSRHVHSDIVTWSKSGDWSCHWLLKPLDESEKIKNVKHPTEISAINSILENFLCVPFIVVFGSLKDHVYLDRDEQTVLTQMPPSGAVLSGTALFVIHWVLSYHIKIDLSKFKGGRAHFRREWVD